MSYDLNLWSTKPIKIRHQPNKVGSFLIVVNDSVKFLYKDLPNSIKDYYSIDIKYLTQVNLETEEINNDLEIVQLKDFLNELSQDVDFIAEDLQKGSLKFYTGNII